MDENLNLCEILKDCPKGEKLFSPLIGEAYFERIDNKNSLPIAVSKGEYVFYFDSKGGYIQDFQDAECLLFPSKDQRDWSKFKYYKPKFNPNTLKPYDKVLLKNENNTWNCALISHIEGKKVYLVTGAYVYYCIPYNEETKHLLGTTGKAPKYYRYWEG